MSKIKQRKTHLKQVQESIYPKEKENTLKNSFHKQAKQDHLIGNVSRHKIQIHIDFQEREFHKQFQKEWLLRIYKILFENDFFYLHFDL